MKTFATRIKISFCLTLFIIFPAHAVDVSVLTFNLRVPVDQAPNDWASRKPRVVDVIKNQHPDFLGVQESIPLFVTDLLHSLPGYRSLGRGREVGGGGEGTQIFFREDRWQLDPQDTGTLQFSSTPDIPGSNDWHMQWPRIFTWAHFREKKSGKMLYVFNTHFPLTPEERERSVKLLAEAIHARKNTADPVILTGDFNACESEASMQYLLGKNGSPIALQDTFRTRHPNDLVTSFHGFGKVNDECKIDYIYTLGEWDVLKADVIKDSEGPAYASDHYAVSASLRIKH